MKTLAMNESEREFVEYLQLRGYGEPERHPPLNENKRGKRPDFGLRLDSTRFFFEVKAFAERDLPPSGAIDPYAPIHNKIEATLGQIRIQKSDSSKPRAFTRRNRHS